jgi:hypothetical protein
LTTAGLALNIIIDETDNIGCLFNEIVVDLPPHLSQFELDDIIWILEESKHKYDTRYKQGDIQLIASLIAACQLNFIHSKKIYPEHLYGIKVVGEEFYFYKVLFSENIK